MRVRVGIRSTIFKFPFLFGYILYHICILVRILPRNISMEEDLSCESA